MSENENEQGQAAERNRRKVRTGVIRNTSPQLETTTMKTKWLFLVFALVLFSCSNDDTSTTATVANLIGEWTWVESSGGLVGDLQTPESIGATRSLIFTSTALQSFEDGQLVAEWDYTLQTQESLLFNEPREMLITDLSFNSIIELNGNELTLIGDCYDCVSSTYVKRN